MRVVRAALRPLVSRSTYRGWAWLILGGAVLMPYLMAGEVVAVLAGRTSAEPFTMLMHPTTFLLVLPVVAATGLVLPVRPLLVLTARGLLGAAIPERREHDDWRTRGRTAGWYTLQLAIGGLLSGLTLALVPFVGVSLVLPLFGDPAAVSGELQELGWQLWWGPVLGPLALLALVYLVAGVSAGLRRAASLFLGPSAAERLAAAREQAEQLATRNRLARELHDSVGHALSVVTLQAAAAGRVLDRDPDQVRRALAAVEETARRALEDLDHALGVLREEPPAPHHPAPQPDLRQLPELLAGCGLALTAAVAVTPEQVPGQVSREAYRIVQEALTNALRHSVHPPSAPPPAALRVERAAAGLVIEVTNPYSATARVDARPGGRGLAGMRERVAVLGGTIEAGAVGDQWRVRAYLPAGRWSE